MITDITLPEGYTPKYKHIRDRDPLGRFRPCGGATVCSLHIYDRVVQGVAYCHPRDNFDKRVGREISLARAVEKVLEDVRLAVQASPLPRSC